MIRKRSRDNSGRRGRQTKVAHATHAEGRGKDKIEQDGSRSDCLGAAEDTVLELAEGI